MLNVSPGKVLLLHCLRSMAACGNVFMFADDTVPAWLNQKTPNTSDQYMSAVDCDQLLQQSLLYMQLFRPTTLLAALQQHHMSSHACFVCCRTLSGFSYRLKQSV